MRCWSHFILCLPVLVGAISGSRIGSPAGDRGCGPPRRRRQPAARVRLAAAQARLRVCRQARCRADHAVRVDSPLGVFITLVRHEASLKMYTEYKNM